MNRQELFCKLSDIVYTLDGFGLEECLVAKMDYNLFMLYYRAGCSLSEEHHYLLCEEGHEDLLEIAALFGPIALSEDVQQKMPKELFEAYLEGAEFTSEQIEKLKLKDEDITEQQLKDMTEIVFGCNRAFMDALDIAKENELDAEINASGREDLINAYSSFIDGEEVDVSAVSIDSYHHLVSDIILEYLC